VIRGELGTQLPPDQDNPTTAADTAALLGELLLGSA
jgi:hypothetical protein